MTTFTRIVAYGLAVAVAGFVVVLAIAGVSAAVALVVTAVAVLAMIALGGIFGGRRAAERDPLPWPPPPAGSGSVPVAGSPGGEPAGAVGDVTGADDEGGTMGT